MGSKDNKNAILAVVLSGIILFGWNYFFAPQPYEQASQEAVQNTKNNINNFENTSNQIVNDANKENKIAPAQLENFILRNDKTEFTINSKLRVINAKSANSALDLNSIYKISESTLIINKDNQKISPLFSFEKINDSNYKIVDSKNNINGSVVLSDVGSLVFNISSNAPFVPEMSLVSTKQLVDEDETRANNFSILGDGLDLIAVGDEDTEKLEFKFNWFGLDFNYHFFGFILDAKTLYKLETQGNKLRIATINQVSNFQYKAVFLKKNYDDLKAMGDNLDKTVDFGIWEVIAVPILRGLQMFFDIFKNYGIAIIMLTILMRFVTFPLQYKSFKSMKKMQVIQPELKEIKEKFKDNPQKIQQETMALFKKAGANPIGGCLPMLLQMPIFFAFYKVLFTSVELVDAPFYFWITDLSQKDPFYVLPVLMGLAMFLNMKITPSTTTDPAQQKVMMLMPVMFSVFMINLPSGLTLYILVSTVVGMLQQLFVFKRTT